MDGMEKIRMRCHISIIFESLWQFWAVILLMLVNQIDNIVDIINEFGAAGLKGLIASGGQFIGFNPCFDNTFYNLFVFGIGCFRIFAFACLLCMALYNPCLTFILIHKYRAVQLYSSY